MRLELGLEGKGDIGVDLIARVELDVDGPDEVKNAVVVIREEVGAEESDKRSIGQGGCQHVCAEQLEEDEAELGRLGLLEELDEFCRATRVPARKDGGNEMLCLCRLLDRHGRAVERLRAW